MLAVTNKESTLSNQDIHYVQVMNYPDLCRRAWAMANFSLHHSYKCFTTDELLAIAIKLIKGQPLSQDQCTILETGMEITQRKSLFMPELSRKSLSIQEVRNIRKGYTNKDMVITTTVALVKPSMLTESVTDRIMMVETCKAEGLLLIYLERFNPSRLYWDNILQANEIR